MKIKYHKSEHLCSVSVEAYELFTDAALVSLMRSKNPNIDFKRKVVWKKGPTNMHAYYAAKFEVST
jgi:hypothetical protein